MGGSIQNALEALSEWIREAVPGDEGVSDGEERFVDVMAPLIPDAESAVLVQPSQRSLDDPSEGTQSAPVWCSPFHDVRPDASRAKLLAMWFRVVSTVRIDFVRSMSWTAPFAPYSRNRVHQWHQLRDVMGVRPSQDC